ncbi:MAG TPA: DUF1549 and DUF1553 domain-containing protein [Gemmataceae bacterium]|nr:DUF1549 and DUF1553 domain-containing protein [Gemmataceae bacterium]
MPAWIRSALPLALLTAAVPAVRANDTWWSFKPIAKPAAPATDPRWGRNPIDAFVLAKLHDRGLSPAPEADRRTLIRRLTFDLIGLPPTLEEIDAFLKDTSPDAYEKLVDRLLASPHYGERWARHWMDVVHFAETHGHDQDRIRPNAWRYRDYLIRSFNDDTPYSRFVQEQLAADVLFPERPDLIPALGFLAAGPWDESSLRDIRDDSIDRQVGYYLDRDDVVTTVMNTFQGLTVQCARCHDHKFDPIAQVDYYRLQAVFAGVGRGEVNFDPDPATAAKRRRLTAALAAIPPTPDPWGDLTARAGVASQVPAPLAVYAAAPNFNPDNSHKPIATPRTVHVLKRGDIHKPGEVAEPGALACLPGLPDVFELPANHPEGARRAALAKWLTEAKNPLTWRVMVNRVWQYHFGRGIVGTPSDFGKMGQLPTHPELLDWLAAEFRDNGQSLKKLHRLIVTSSTYRQASRHDPKFAELDADNHLLWRMNRTRLDAEQLRDAILLVSNRLDRTPGGPSDRQFDLKPGIHVTPIVDYAKFDWDRPQGHRRSVYRFVFRTLPDPLVDCLDGADASQLTAKRNESVTAPQALALLNNEFVLVHSKAFAAWLEKQTTDREKQVVMACERVWGRPPTAEERKAFVAFADKHGLANLCRVLFNSNEFLFVD